MQKRLKLASKSTEKHEGYRQLKYIDTEGHETIGIGFNLEVGFSLEESRLILEHRLGYIDSQLWLRSALYRELSEEIKAVLIEMAYNLGINGLFQFKKMFYQLRIGHNQTAAEEMLDSKWARQVGNRAKHLAEIVRNEP